MIKREDFLDAVQVIKNLRQKEEQPSDLPILPSHQSRQRPFQQRQSKWHLVRLILILVGMDRIAILVHPFKVEGLPMIFHFFKEFR